MPDTKKCLECKNILAISEFADSGKHSYCRECMRSRTWRQKYGLDADQLKEIIIAQSNRCRICKEDLPYPPHVDHNHETGDIRGLLCRSCNTALGLMRDNPAYLRAAADYLESAPIAPKPPVHSGNRTIGAAASPETRAAIAAMQSRYLVEADPVAEEVT